MMRQAMATLPRDGRCHSVAGFGNEGVVFTVLIWFVHSSSFTHLRSLVAAIGIFRMLQGPQRAAARNRRYGRKVIRRRRRTDGPFQCPRVPRVVTGPGSPEIRNYEVRQKHKNCECLDKCTDRDDEVQSVPTTARLVGVDPTGHAQNAGNVHDVERQVKTDEEKPEMPFAEPLAQHPASHFWIPVIKRAEERE